jgi:hypothetical protein
VPCHSTLLSLLCWFGNNVSIVVKCPMIENDNHPHSSWLSEMLKEDMFTNAEVEKGSIPPSF